MRAELVAPKQPVRQDVVLTLTYDEARVLRAIAATNISVPEVVEEFTGDWGFTQSMVSRFLADTKAALIAVNIHLLAHGEKI